MRREDTLDVGEDEGEQAVNALGGRGSALEGIAIDAGNATEFVR